MALRSAPQDTLVLMSCGAAKIATHDPVPLIELYDGPIWRDLRANRGEIPDGNVFVLSGKHGFTSVTTYARPYEEKISAAKVDALIARGIHGQEQHRKGLPSMSVHVQVKRYTRGDLKPWPYEQAIVYGSGEYRRAFDAIVEWLFECGHLVAGAPVAKTEGSILIQRRQFNEFLREAR